MKTIVITGVSRGLGLALLQEFQSLGHRVSGCCRHEGRAQELNAQLADQGLVRSLDVLDAVAVNDWARATQDQLGHVDLVLNNAAYFNKRANLWDIPDEEFERVMRVNVEGPFHVARAFLPSMIGRKSGVLVNYTSARGRNPAAEVAPYCASKAAVESMTLALALELPQGLAAVAVNPGAVNTDMLGVSIGERKSEFWAPKEWAESAAPFLLGLGPSDNGKSLRTPERG